MSFPFFLKTQPWIFHQSHEKEANVGKYLEIQLDKV